MSDNIEHTKAAVNELPDMDYVHCYDYEIRTDNLKALAVDHSALLSLIESAEIIQLRGGTLSKYTGGGWNVYLGEAKDAVHCDTALEGYAKIAGEKSV